ncbi:MAG: hypothetical protein WBF71_12545 [Microthrixaceae bacterium]
MAYLMVDPVHDEHELAMLELRVFSLAPPGNGPPSSQFNPSDPAAVDLEVTVGGAGPILHTERLIPAYSSLADISRITLEFVDELVIDLPALSQQVANMIDGD